MIRIVYMFFMILTLPVTLAEYFRKTTGKDYGISFFKKLILMFKMIRSHNKITTASKFLEHITMVTNILKTPKSIEGCIVECGCYKGGSTSILSLAAGLCNRQLEIFDSFAGLPEPSEYDKMHISVGDRKTHTYAKGDFYGSLEEVKSNISQYGNINVCNFNIGYFEDTLPKFDKKCVFVYVDVDLRDSLKPCLKYLWPLLQDKCNFFTHEAPHMEIAFLFFDKEWWQSNINANPPGLIGAGSGLGLLPRRGAFQSDIGFTVKNPY